MCPDFPRRGTVLGEDEREAARGPRPSAANEEGKEAGSGGVFGRCHGRNSEEAGG